MLSEIYIENLAVIQKAIIPLENRLNIFTGETGAGKSILIGGINAVMGLRITKDIVRSGTDKAVISALFRDLSESTVKMLDEYGISHDDGELLLTREIFADGGSAARINSRSATVSMLREIGETLINIHGQHDNQTLLAPEKHMDILDSFGELQNEIDDYRASFKELQNIAKRIKTIIAEEKGRSDRLIVLSARIKEIGALELTENEDITLEAEYLLHKNSSIISQAIYRAKYILSGDEEADGCTTMLESAYQSLNEQSELLSDLELLAERMKSLRIESADIASELERLDSALSFDESRFEQIKDRRQKLFEIKKKYGCELSDIISMYNDSVAEVEKLSRSDDELIELKKQKEHLLADATSKAKALSAKRERAAESFIQSVSEELRFLDMPNVRLDVKNEKGKLTVNGMDSMEFLISVNVGEPPKPISKIASGGELSRIMLALKNVIADKDDIPTLIFDEIDTGVSGRAAQKIGIKLSRISRLRQVLCVTHLSQLAVMADNHLLIEKKTENDRTYTTVTQLDVSARTAEIARIMGGDTVTELTLRSAEEQIKKAEILKQTLDNS